MREPLRILMLAANPVDRYRLELTAEYRLLRNRMYANSEAGSCDLTVEWAARAQELKRALRETRPHIVHFSGHGHNESICLEDEDRRSRPLSKRELALLFNLSRSRIRVVVLNACYSARQVESLGEVVDYIVGTNVPVTDDAALQFTNDFYRSIAVGSTVREAFNKAQVTAMELSGQASQYELLVRPEADESTLLPPFTTTAITTEIEEIVTTEMNVAENIVKGSKPPVAPQSQSNANREMNLKSRRLEADTFNFAATIWKQGK